MLTLKSMPSRRERALPSLDHAHALLREHGIVQFAREDVADLDSGFCLDDNTRALLVAVVFDSLGGHEAREIGERALRFIRDASAEAPCYHNMMDRHGAFTDEGASPESIGRLIWALGVTAVCARERAWRDAAWAQLEKASHAVGALTTSHARSYAMLGLAAITRPGAAAPCAPAARGATVRSESVRRWAQETLYAAAAAMQFEFERNAQPDWAWWEDRLTYDNARLPEAMVRAALALHEPSFGESGLEALQFLTALTQPHRMLVPIGAPHWYERGGARRIFDQQPLEAAAMVDAFLAALRFTGAPRYLDAAAVAYDWYRGRNTAGLVVADVASGGCHDAITENGLNPNMGAESTLAYLQASLFLSVAAERR